MCLESSHAPPNSSHGYLFCILQISELQCLFCQKLGTIIWQITAVSEVDTSITLSQHIDFFFFVAYIPVCNYFLYMFTYFSHLNVSSIRAGTNFIISQSNPNAWYLVINQ